MRGRDSRLPLITPPLQLPPSPVLPTNSRVKIPGRQKVFHILGRGKNGPREREKDGQAAVQGSLAGPKSENSGRQHLHNYSEKDLQNAVFLSLTAFLQSEQEKERWARIAGRQTPKSEKAERHHGKALSPCFCCLPLDFAFFWM